jgi:NADH-ubiquinone oxidoreductase chain 4
MLAHSILRNSNIFLIVISASFFLFFYVLKAFLIFFIIFNFFMLFILGLFTMRKPLFENKININYFFRINFISSVYFFLYCLLMFYILDPTKIDFHLTWTLNIFNFFLIDFGLDNLALIFLFLIGFLFPICYLVHFTSNYNFSKNTDYNKQLEGYSVKFLFSSILLQTILILFFCCLDLFSFYILFEGSMFPLFLIIFYYGSRNNRIKAAYYLFFYTIIGSISFLIGLSLL